MKIFNYEIKKIKKEKVITFTRGADSFIKIESSGDGWGSFESYEICNEITDILNQLPKKLTIDEKIDVLKLFSNSDITFKIVD